MTAYQALLTAATVVFGYVLLRFVVTLLRVRCREDRRFAGAGIVFAVAVPILGTMQSGSLVTDEDLPLYALGSVIWVTLALAFSAYAVSRSRGLRIT